MNLMRISWWIFAMLIHEMCITIDIIDVLTKNLDSLWASEQSLFNTNALKMYMLAIRWDVCYKLLRSCLEFNHTAAR